MELVGQTVVVTGGAQGIGAAVASAFSAQGASVWVLDVSDAAPGHSDQFLQCDVSDADALSDALQYIRASAGNIDVYVSNAGVMSRSSGSTASIAVEDWERCWSVNVLAHVHAARLLVPDMIARGGGCFVIIASAAGLLTQVGDAAYSATKHAAVSIAESLAIDYGGDGINVSLVCPQYVATPLIDLTSADAACSEVLLTAEEIGASVVRAIREKTFLVLPHPEVAGYAQRRAQDHDRWIAGMAGLRQRAQDRFGRVDPLDFYKLL